MNPLLSFALAVGRLAYGDVATVQAMIDADLKTVLPQIAALQGTYKGGKTVYYQGLPIYSKANVPKDGTPGVADQTSAKPTYQATDWTGFGIAAWTKGYCIEVHQYVGPAGTGWLVISSFVDGASGATWIRTDDSGPEPERTTVWRKIVPTPALK